MFFISLYCRYIKINITEKPSLCTGLFTGETRLLLIRSTEPEPCMCVCVRVCVSFSLFQTHYSFILNVFSIDVHLKLQWSTVKAGSGYELSLFQGLLYKHLPTRNTPISRGTMLCLYKSDSFQYSIAFIDSIAWPKTYFYFITAHNFIR